MAMTLGTAAALAGGGVVSSVLGGLFGSSATNSANAAQLQAVKMQNDFNEKMWNMNNEYNTPLAQRQRLEQAGLNPNLAYSGVNTGNSSSPVTQSSLPNIKKNDAWQRSINDIGNTIVSLSNIVKNVNEAKMSTYDTQLRKLGLEQELANYVNGLKLGGMTTQKGIDFFDLEKNIQRYDLNFQNAFNIWKLRNIEKYTDKYDSMLDYEIAKSRADKELIPTYRNLRIAEANNALWNYELKKQLHEFRKESNPLNLDLLRLQKNMEQWKYEQRNNPLFGSKLYGIDLGSLTHNGWNKLKELWENMTK